MYLKKKKKNHTSGCRGLTSERKNAEGNQFSKTPCHRAWPGLIHGTPPLLIEPALFWDQGLPPGSTCGQDLHSAFRYQRLFSTPAPKMLIPGSERCILEWGNCNFCIIYVLGVWYANSEHYFFFPPWHMASLIPVVHDPSWPRPSRTRSMEKGQLLFWSLSVNPLMSAF